MIAEFRPIVLLGAIVAFATFGAAHAATVVALGTSNTFGKGVSRSQAYPAQLETLLRARGLGVRVINAGINGDTTGAMLARLDRVVPKGTSVVILQPGGNDRRKLAADNTPEIQSRLAAMGIKVVMLPNGMLHGLPLNPTGSISRQRAIICWQSSWSARSQRPWGNSVSPAIELGPFRASGR